MKPAYWKTKSRGKVSTQIVELGDWGIKRTGSYQDIVDYTKLLESRDVK